MKNILIANGYQIKSENEKNSKYIIKFQSEYFYAKLFTPENFSWDEFVELYLKLELEEIVPKSRQFIKLNEGGILINTYIGETYESYKSSKITESLIDAINKLHDLGFVHGDIQNPCNIVVDIKKQKAYLIDLDSCDTISNPKSLEDLKENWEMNSINDMVNYEKSLYISKTYKE